MTIKIITIDNNEFLFPKFMKDISNNNSIKCVNYIKTDFQTPTLKIFRLWIMDLYKYPTFEDDEVTFIFKPDYFIDLDFAYLIDLFKFALYFDIELLCNTLGYVMANKQNLGIYVYINGNIITNCTVFDNESGLSYNFIDEIKYISKFITYGSTRTNDFIVDVLHLIEDYEEPIEYDKYIYTL